TWGTRPAVPTSAVLFGTRRFTLDLDAAGPLCYGTSPRQCARKREPRRERPNAPPHPALTCSESLAGNPVPQR
ncbi:MAG TPA: hypothetical protein VGY53_12475, partial [Isosphaeraceae bacterium]|nr:hypothetical protein [Isosphaeraceae bacterium]